MNIVNNITIKQSQTKSNVMTQTTCNTPSLYIYKVYHNAANVNKLNVDFYKHILTLPHMTECANNLHYRIFNKNLSTYQN